MDDQEKADLAVMQDEEMMKEVYAHEVQRDKVMEENKMDKTDFSSFEGDYVALVTDEEKQLGLTNWKVVMRAFGDNPPSATFEANVFWEDGKDVPLTKGRLFSKASKRFIKKLKPIIHKAEEDNREEIKLSVLKIGDKFDTQYILKELPMK